MNTPEFITELQPQEVFVFGSNLAGNHAGGAAKMAREQFGAIDGIGEGLMGQSYAFPTLTEDMEQLYPEQLEAVRDRLYLTAVMHPDKTFLLTRVGCGIAGIAEPFMVSLFRVKLSNIMYPEGW